MIKNVSVSLLLLAGFVAAQNPVVRQSPVTLMTTVAATGSATSSAIRLPNDSNFGTLTVVGSGITGSPSGCQVTLANQQVTAGATSSVFATQAFTPGSSYQAFQITPSSAAFDTGDMVVAVFSCSVYPGAGTISIGFSPTAPPSGVIGTVAISAASLPLPANAAQETGGNLATIKNSVGNIPALGQALAGSSVPVVLTAAQISTMTPPAAITGFALESGGNLAAIKTDTDKIPSQGQALAAGSLPVVLTALQFAGLEAPVIAAGTNNIGKVQILGNAGAAVDQAPGSAVPPSAVQIAGTDGTNTQVPYYDPCMTKSWTYYPVSVSANTQIAAAIASTYFYVCEVLIPNQAGAVNVQIMEGTATACASNTAGLMGGATAALGANVSANGGFMAPWAGRAVAATATANHELCIWASAAVSGLIAYVSSTVAP